MNTFHRALICLALVGMFCGASGRRFGPVVDYVDRIELNHVIDERGESRVDQIIFWNWDKSVGRYTVVAWTLHKGDHRLPFAGYPVYQFRDHGQLRKVVGKHFVETWSTQDPELFERELLPPDRRAGLCSIASRRVLFQR